MVDTNDNTRSIIKTSDVEPVKLSRKKNCNKLNRNDLIKLLSYITLKSPSDLRSQPLQDVNDSATDKLDKSYVSITNDNGKAPAIYSSAMSIHSKSCYMHLVVDLHVILVYGEIILKKIALE